MVFVRLIDLCVMNKWNYIGGKSGGVGMEKICVKDFL